jgi:AcrR family transcriptional regulator
VDPTPDTPLTLRERTRRAVHAEITDTALRLFAEQGFEATTVEQIAAAAGISRRSFFHYFRSKEDVVLGDLEALGRRVRDALEARPATETAWEALRAALKTLHAPGAGTVTALQVADMYADAPSLRAKHLEKHLRWQELFAPDIERRLGIAPGATGDPRARAVIAAALACLDTAVEAWRESGGTADPVDLFDAAVAAVRG